MSGWVCSSQASEHGWAHLSRQTTPHRNRLALSTRNALAHVAANGKYVHPMVEQGAARKKRPAWIVPQLNVNAALKVDEAEGEDAEHDDDAESDSTSNTSSDPSNEEHAADSSESFDSDADLQDLLPTPLSMDITQMDPEVLVAQLGEDAPRAASGSVS